MEWILNRLKEPSSWRGLIALASICGLSLSPELSEQIITVAVAAVAIVEIIRREKTPPEAANAVTPDKRTVTFNSDGEVQKPANQ